MQKIIDVDNSKFAQSKLHLDIIEELDVIEFSGPYDGIFYLWSGDIDELIDYLQKAKIKLCQKE